MGVMNSNYIVHDYASSADAIAGGLKQGQDMAKSMYDQKQKVAEDGRANQTREAMKGAFSVGPDGRMVMNKEGMGALAAADPEKAYAIQSAFDEKEAAAKKAQFEQQQKQLGIFGQLFGAAKDQASYDYARTMGTKMGLPGMEELPRQFDEKFTKHAQVQALTANEQVGYLLKEMEQSRKAPLDKAELAYKKSQTAKNYADAKNSGAGGGVSDGEKAVDKKFAENYNNYTSSGLVNADASIAKLEAIAAELESDQGMFQSGGGRVASLPDGFRSRDAIRRRDTAKSAANSTLKNLFPGALSDAEREAASNEYYNDQLDNTANAKIIREKVAQLKAARETEMAKVRHYEKNRTLRGFRMDAGPPPPPSDSVAMTAPDGSVRMVPKDQVQAAIKAGGKPVNGVAGK